MSSNVIQFPTRTKPAEPAAAPQRSSLRSPAPAGAEVNEQAPASVKEMFKQSAAMTLIATLSFYAQQGWDGGQKARDAMPALKELMATKGIHLVTSPQ